MTITGSHSVFVRRTQAEVFGLVSNLELAPRWVPGLVEVIKLSPGPVAVGSRYRQRIHLAGRDLEGELEVSELEPLSRFAHTGQAGPARLAGRFDLACENGGTRLTHHHEIRLSGLARAMAPLVASRAEHGTADALERLRRLLEEGAAG